MDGRSTSDIDSVERFVFFVLHLSCFSFSTVSERVKSHKIIYSDKAAGVVVVAAVVSPWNCTCSARQCLALPFQEKPPF